MSDEFWEDEEWDPEKIIRRRRLLVILWLCLIAMVVLMVTA
jgi:hypothetical protein